MNQRRYSDDEVRRIFELATERRALPAGGGATSASGLTLDQIQGIAGEVGISPQEVARAAVALDSRPAATVGRTMGMPAAVGRMVPLSRNLTDGEWDQLVAELRSTFRARGKVTTVGGLREWSNGKLHACIEPADGGYRLRLGTFKSDAGAINTLGAGSVGVGTLLFAGTLMAGSPELAAPFILAGGGALTMLANALRLPRWAAERQRQMDHIAARAAALVDSDS